MPPETARSPLDDGRRTTVDVEDAEGIREHGQDLPQVRNWNLGVASWSRNDL